MWQFIRVICIISLLSICLPSITSRERKIFGLKKRKLCWHTKFSLSKANLKPPQSLWACKLTIIFSFRREYLTTRYCWSNFFSSSTMSLIVIPNILKAFFLAFVQWNDEEFAGHPIIVPTLFGRAFRFLLMSPPPTLLLSLSPPRPLPAVLS